MIVSLIRNRLFLRLKAENTAVANYGGMDALLFLQKVFTFLLKQVHFLDQLTGIPQFNR